MHSSKEKNRLNSVLKTAKQQTATKDITTFAFARFFSTLLALIAPFITKKNYNTKR